MFYQDLASRDEGGLQSSSRSSSNQDMQDKMAKEEEDYFKSESSGGAGAPSNIDQFRVTKYLEEQLSLGNDGSMKNGGMQLDDEEEKIVTTPNDASKSLSLRRRQRTVIRPKINQQEESKIEDSLKDRSHLEDSKSSIQLDEESKKQQEEHQQYLEMRAIIQNQKITNVSQILFQEKVKTVIQVVLLALLFCSYFIAGYFFSVNSFAQTPGILVDLDTIYFQDISYDSLMAFVREDYFYNTSIKSEDNNLKTGTEDFLERSEQRSKSYLELRKNMPGVFGEIKQYIEDLETDKLCHITFKGQPDKRKICETIYKGVLDKGLTYATNVILSHFRNLNLQFLSAKDQRNLTFISDALRNQDTLQLIEMQQFVLSDLILRLKDRVTSSTAAYYDRLINQYKGLFSAFILLMTMLFLGYIIFGYNHIKESMWKTNLTLKIMPLDFIPKHCLPELKAFFRY